MPIFENICTNYMFCRALKLFNVDHTKSGRKKPSWDVVKVTSYCDSFYHILECVSITDNLIPTQCPRQPDSSQCGHFVMRYMRQIIEEYRNVENTPLRSIVNSLNFFLMHFSNQFEGNNLRICKIRSL